jgi:hypothetical protein
VARTELAADPVRRGVNPIKRCASSVVEAFGREFAARLQSLADRIHT